MASVTEVKPCRDSWCRTISRIEYWSPIGTSGFGRLVVYGRSRTPLPPARITACMLNLLGGQRSWSDRVGAGSVQGEVGRFAEPVDRELEPVGQRVPGPPRRTLLELGAVTDQAHHLRRVGAQPL